MMSWQAKINPLVDELAGLYSQDDISAIVELLHPDSRTSLLLFEHSWASKFATAVQNAEGTIIALPTSTRLVGRAMR